MKIYKSIAKQFSFSVIIKIISYFINFLLFVAVTRAMSVEIFGLFSIFLVTITILTLILSFGLPEAVTRLLAGKKADLQAKYIKCIIFALLPVIALILIVFYFTKEAYLSLFNMHEHFAAFQMILGIVFLSVVSEIIVGLLKARQKLISSQILTFFAMTFWAFLVVILAFFRTLTIENIFLTRLFMIFATLAVTIIILRKFLKLSLLSRFNLKYLLAALAFGLPLLPALISEFFITASDRYILGFFHGSAQVGLYSYIYTIVSIILSFALTVPVILYPYAAKYYNINRKQKANFLFNAAIKYSMIILLPVLSLFFVFSKQLIVLVSGEKFLPSIIILPILIFFPILHVLNIICQQLLMVLNKTRTICMLYVTAMILNLILNFQLIPKYQASGASMATLITYLVLFIMFALFIRKFIKINMRFLRMGGIFLSTVVLIAAAYFLSYFVSWYASMIIAGLLYLFMLFLLKVYIKDEYKFIKSILKEIRNRLSAKTI